MGDRRSLRDDPDWIQDLNDEYARLQGVDPEQEAREVREAIKWARREFKKTHGESNDRAMNRATALDEYLDGE